MFGLVKVICTKFSLESELWPRKVSLSFAQNNLLVLALISQVRRSTSSPVIVVRCGISESGKPCVA